MNKLQIQHPRESDIASFAIQKEDRIRALKKTTHHKHPGFWLVSQHLWISNQCWQGHPHYRIWNSRSSATCFRCGAAAWYPNTESWILRAWGRRDCSTPRSKKVSAPAHCASVYTSDYPWRSRSADSFPTRFHKISRASASTTGTGPQDALPNSNPPANNRRSNHPAELPPLRSSPLDELLQTAALENKPAASQQPSSNHHSFPSLQSSRRPKNQFLQQNSWRKKKGEKKMTTLNFTGNNSEKLVFCKVSRETRGSRELDDEGAS